jgi:hypothetical protein
MAGWRQRTVRTECSGEKHRVVLYPNGHVATPDHGPEHAALAAVSGEMEENACGRMATKIRGRIFGNYHFSDAIPAKVRVKCEEISLATATFRCQQYPFIEGPYAGVDVLLVQWKLHLMQTSTVHGMEPIEHVFGGGDARICCEQVAQIAAERAAKSGMLGCARLSRVPMGCSDANQHAAVAVADHNGLVRVAHGVITRMGEGWNIADPCMRKLWMSDAFLGEWASTRSGAPLFDDVRVWGILRLAQRIEAGARETAADRAGPIDPPEQGGKP